MRTGGVAVVVVELGCPFARQRDGLVVAAARVTRPSHE